MTRAASAVLLAVAVTAACDTRSPFEPSLPVEAGFRVDDGVLKLWTGTPCHGVHRVTLIFDVGTQGSTWLEWDAPRPGVTLEHLDLLRTDGGSLSPVDGADGGLRLKEPLPAGFDWTKARSINFSVDGPPANGARADVARVLHESAQHPAGTYLFNRAGWMDPTQVRRENGKSFLTVCTPDPDPVRYPRS